MGAREGADRIDAVAMGLAGLICDGTPLPTIAVIAACVIAQMALGCNRAPMRVPAEESAASFTPVGTAPTAPG
jgi:hypothetical protein